MQDVPSLETKILPRAAISFRSTGTNHIQGTLKSIGSDVVIVTMSTPLIFWTFYQFLHDQNCLILFEHY